MNEMIRSQARWPYGDKVDAVVNVVYGSNPRNDVYATGLAVRFVEGTDDSKEERPSAQSRLEELRALFDQGLINKKEYDQKRAEILRGL